MLLRLPQTTVFAALLLLAGCSEPEPAALQEPQMQMIPAGSFSMGCLAEVACRDDELPRHAVSLPGFELAAREVSFAEWDLCVAAGSCEHRPDVGPRGAYPVFNVAWQDVQQYITWLNSKTGKRYRLPSEAEWEYAARAGSQSNYGWGDCVDSSQANFNGEKPLQGCASSEFRQQSLAVGSFRANPWGLYDMHGNVAEWTMDCWNNSYRDAPLDGSSQLQGDCSLRVVRGGGFGDSAELLLSASRTGNSSLSRYGHFGFRLARSLPASP